MAEETRDEDRQGLAIGDPASWARRAVDLIDFCVGLIRDRTVRPLTLVVQGIVFGFLLLVFLPLALVLLSVGVVRLLDDYFFGDRVWISYFVIGALFMTAGAVLWSRRSTEVST